MYATFSNVYGHVSQKIHKRKIIVQEDLEVVSISLFKHDIH